MAKDDAEITLPEPDGHFKLLECSCGGKAGYVTYGTGFGVMCTRCGKHTELHSCKHDAQAAWNGGQGHE